MRMKECFMCVMCDCHSSMDDNDDNDDNDDEPRGHMQVSSFLPSTVDNIVFGGVLCHEQKNRINLGVFAAMRVVVNSSQ